ncbi:hypothetical protein GDO81_015606 [Engystomops pustulosus]|uniref:Uncharacterized protein n=1 Tax=Engystomops pustulosus TaxID=76066 RepID=A0AAV7AL00_ENGPU|nr:hypothetical protein GDO81_015606 [Engystomops pustulosus]
MSMSPASHRRPSPVYITVLTPSRSIIPLYTSQSRHPAFLKLFYNPCGFLSFVTNISCSTLKHTNISSNFQGAGLKLSCPDTQLSYSGPTISLYISILTVYSAAAL